MLPVEPLMAEHRLIERMIKLMAGEVELIKQNKRPNIDFINIALDFIKTYADRLHHGKEEDILFRVLAKKKMSMEHKKIMDELVQEHILGRGNVKKLAEASNKFIQGENASIGDIIKNMEILVKFYPKHIEKEDKRFFIPVMDYLSKQEKQQMLNGFYEFDKKFIHAKYQGIVLDLEERGFL